MSDKESIENAEAAKPDPLSVLFPERRVDLGHGIHVTVRPLPLADLPKISEAFGKVLAYAAQGIHPAQITLMALSEVIQCLKYTIDRDPTEIPSTAAPRLMEVFIEQNLDADTLGNWSTLIGKIRTMREAVEGVDQGPQTTGAGTSLKQ